MLLVSILVSTLRNRFQAEPFTTHFVQARPVEGRVEDPAGLPFFRCLHWCSAGWRPARCCVGAPLPGWLFWLICSCP